MRSIHVIAEPGPALSPPAVLSVRGLHVRFRTGAGILHAVRGIDLDVAQGETVAVVGESGSGKSQTMLAVMGLLASNGTVEGSARYRGHELVGLAPAALNRFRGARIGMVFQEPMTSLDPLYRIGAQLILPLMAHGKFTRRQARHRALELLRLVRIDDAVRRLDAYPHELSGGQRQRVMIAMALANNPDLLIADEPTSALDVTTQAHLLDLLGELQQRLGMAVVFITHDLRLVRRFARRVYVMKDGQVVEHGSSDDVFSRPTHAYTRRLVDVEPHRRKTPIAAEARPVLEAADLQVRYRSHSSLFGRAHHDIVAVDRANLMVRAGETVAVVGESGSGKSSLGRAILRLQPASGRLKLGDIDLMALDPRALRRLRRDMQIVFQDPFGSLSPRKTAGEIVTEGLLVHDPALSRRERDRRAALAFEEVRLDASARNRFPHEFSGGQRQRIAIARAMILRPRLVVLDEPTSALDRSVQREILELLLDLQQAHGLAYVFISHDLTTVRAMSDNVLVMHQGRVIERGPTELLFERPQQDYTQQLIAAAMIGEPVRRSH
jgi:ABC-type microcin C transport system duplicated ATPase subunit YejF